MDTKTIYKTVINMLQKNGAKKISIFGSRAKGLEKPDSDLDILVEFSTIPTLLKIVKIERELSEKIGIKIDLLTEKAISPLLIDKIKREAITIFG